uniref:hypothetical protein n=1 Tax=Haloprofundus sp. MHR1 TaxID=2572921 RepID=UPI001F3A2366|nr:hypothetical protein [Haloprofundus sp. MHR1]
MSGADIPSDSTAIIDSSVLFAMGGPSNEKYQAFERFVRRQGITVTVPEQVAEELGESPDAYEYHVTDFGQRKMPGGYSRATSTFQFHEYRKSSIRLERGWQRSQQPVLGTEHWSSKAENFSRNS